ncbi:DUF3508 domain-containing protein [Chloropicon primus]|uniref:Cilia- and flagella-associated protein 206 n=1 Tax=Chloropicon primus TaxID=1764295 RepID=A0A5B8MXK6_9CHLO|nr:DUF3508 domain-containing protein [Chloropicon primus]UPR04735.1 DUF3508 domain-containing protein [Chloropicon primus]|eukprot:QDZ25538.1 DUF3508 domain-containing protein [Chloropicon primus]
MDTDEILYTVSEAVRRSREMQDEARDKQKSKSKETTSSSGKFGSSACLLEPTMLQDIFLSPSEAFCAFLTITLHLKRAHGLPGPSSLDEMSQAVCQRIQAALGCAPNAEGGQEAAAPSESDCMLETVALQIAYWEKKRERRDLLAGKRKWRVEKIFTLQEEITKTKLNAQDTLASNAVCAKVYDLMVDFTIEAADLYNWSERGLEFSYKDRIEREERQSELEQKIRNEVRSALESVFPLYSVRSFCLDIYDNKVKQLGELCRLVVGILCFNSFTGKSATFMDSLRSLSPSKKTLLASQKGAWHVVVLLKHLSLIAANARRKWKKLEKVESSEKEKVSDLVSLAEQSMCICLEQGLEWNSLGVDSAENSDRISMLLAQLKTMVEGKHAVSKDTVYPLFDSIGRLYFEGLDLGFREEAIKESSFMRTLLSDDSGVTESDLAVFMQPPFIRRLRQAEASGGMEDHDLLDLDEEGDNDLESIEKDEVVKDVMQAWPSPLTKAPQEEGKEAADEREYDVFEYGGYCPVSIVEDKILRRGLARCGVCILEPSYSSTSAKAASPGAEGDGASAGTKSPQDRWFAFASKKYRTKFLKTPGRYTAQVTLECVTRLPQLISLLKLSPDRATVDFVCQLVNASEKSKEYGTQTPTHYVEKFVDPNYCWNEWDLRKRGLQMANLRQKKTHSGQTDKSHFRREVETQVYLSRDSDTQTKVGAAQGMPRKVRHITGLRGDPKTKKMSVVEVQINLEKSSINGKPVVK